MSRIAIVSVSYGSEGVLPGFLDSVPAASSADPLVIVADNKPDGVAEKIVREHGASYLALPQNAGYGGAINAAIATFDDDVEWILVSNPDIVLGEGSLDELVRVGEADPTIGSLGPLVYTDGEIYPSARTIPSLRTGIGHALFANLWPSNPWSARYHSDNELPPRERDAGWLSGSNVLVRRTAYDAIGGFDDKYFMYFEDVDLGYRLSKSGWRNRYVPSAQVSHSGAHSTDTEGSSKKMVNVHHQSAYRFLSRKYSGVLLSPVRLALKVGLSARAYVVTRLVRR